MANLFLYSVNPKYAHDIATNYRNGNHFVWCSDYFDPSTAGSQSLAASIAPSSNPCNIFHILKEACEKEDSHNHLISGYRKTFRRLAKEWLADTSITKSQFDEIISVTKSPSWKIWRPQLYVISRPLILSRLVGVAHKSRAAYGPEQQIPDLQSHEFEIIEW